MDVKEWVKAVTRAGWIIGGRREQRLLVKCPARGCQVAVWLNPGQTPRACDPDQSRVPWDHEIFRYEDMVDFLRERRQQLGFTQEDIDRIVGWPDRYTGKLEVFTNDRRKKTPTFPTLIEWASALGYDLVLRPKPLTATAQAVFSEKVHPRG